jgi:hypothetical protein
MLARKLLAMGAPISPREASDPAIDLKALTSVTGRNPQEVA